MHAWCCFCLVDVDLNKCFKKKLPWGAVASSTLHSKFIENSVLKLTRTHLGSVPLAQSLTMTRPMKGKKTRPREKGLRCAGLMGAAEDRVNQVFRTTSRRQSLLETESLSVLHLGRRCPNKRLGVKNERWRYNQGIISSPAEPLSGDRPLGKAALAHSLRIFQRTVVTHLATELEGHVRHLCLWCDNGKTGHLPAQDLTSRLSLGHAASSRGDIREVSESMGAGVEWAGHIMDGLWSPSFPRAPNFLTESQCLCRQLAPRRGGPYPKIFVLMENKHCEVDSSKRALLRENTPFIPIRPWKWSLGKLASEPQERQGSFRASWRVTSSLLVPVMTTVWVLSIDVQLRRTLLRMHKSEEIQSYESHCHSNSHTSRSLFVTCTTERRVNFYGLYYICVMWKGYSGRGSHNSEFSDSYDFQVSVKWLLFSPPWFFLLSGWVCFLSYLGFSELF